MKRSHLCLALGLLYVGAGFIFNHQIREAQGSGKMLGEELARVDEVRFIRRLNQEIDATVSGVEHYYSPSGGSGAAEEGRFERLTENGFYFRGNVAVENLLEIVNRMAADPELAAWQQQGEVLGLQRECRFSVQNLTIGPDRKTVPGKWMIRMLFHESNCPAGQGVPSMQAFRDNHWDKNA